MFRKLFFSILTIIILSSCSNAIKNREISNKLYRNVREGDYKSALKNAKDKDFYTEKNSQLLKSLNLATVYYLNQNYYQALKEFEKAKKISDDLYTTSVSKKIASTWDPNFDNYYGESYERSLIRFYISLINYNLYRQGFYEEYKDENGKKISKRELTNEEKRFHLEYARSSIIEWDSMLQAMQNKSMGKPVYKNDMMAKLWGAFIHSEFQSPNDRQISLQLYSDANDLLLRNYNMYPIFNNKSEDFNNDFKKLHAITFQELQKKYIDRTKYSNKLIEYTNRNRKNLEKYQMDNFVVLIKDGLVSKIDPNEIRIPFPILTYYSSGSGIYDFAMLAMPIEAGMPYIEIEMPEMTEIEMINDYRIDVYDSNKNLIATTDFTMLEPISYIAKKSFDDRKGKMHAAIVARMTGKYVAALGTAYALYSQDNAFMKLGAVASFLASIKTINETSRADIRQWITLPSNIQMAGIKLQPGKYCIEVFKNTKKVLEREIEIIAEETTFLDLNF